jgi:uncharacterized RDD family membrane protein YckC
VSDEIVIGEGVVLDARPASFLSRLVGGVIDLAVISIGGVTVAMLVFGTGLVTDEAIGAAVTIGLLVTALVGVPTTVETLSRGRSLGKLVMGLRVVRDDGGPVRFRQALIRALLGVLELWLTTGAVAVVASLVHPKGKRLGDMVAGTYALRVRGGETTLGPLVMPPELAAWASTADIRRLPDGLALAARQFLGRASRLNVGSRMRLGLDLAARLEPYVAPGPPPGTHPERFIAALLAARRDREYAQALVTARRTAYDEELVARLPHGVPDPW